MSRNGSDGGTQQRGSLVGRLLRLAVLVGPALATVGALVGLAVVVPAAGFVGLLVTTSVAGALLTLFSSPTGTPRATAEEAGGLGYEAYGSEYSIRISTDHLLAAYLYGVAGFGVLGILFVAVFAF